MGLLSGVGASVCWVALSHSLLGMNRESEMSCIRQCQNAVLQFGGSHYQC